MYKLTTEDLDSTAPEVSLSLDELAREGARRLIAAALRLEEALPVLYLRGLSTGDFCEALPVLLGPEAAGLSATTINRLLKISQEEYREWRKRPLHDRDYVYIWADGVYFPGSDLRQGMARGGSSGLPGDHRCSA